MRKLLVCIMLLMSFILVACGGAQPDLVITERGCAAEHFVLASTREPVISVQNQASTPMVLTIPLMVRFVTVAPGSTANFELPRYLMGSFEFFCLSEVNHLSLSGGNPFLCAAEPKEVAPVALSGGIFEIAPHDRIKELSTPSGRP